MFDHYASPGLVTLYSKKRRVAELTESFSLTLQRTMPFRKLSIRKPDKRPDLPLERRMAYVFFLLDMVSD